MSHLNFILPRSEVKSRGGGGGRVMITIKRVVCYRRGLGYKRILTWRDSNLVHYFSPPARKQLMLMNSFFYHYLVSLSGSV